MSGVRRCGNYRGDLLGDALEIKSNGFTTGGTEEHRGNQRLVFGFPCFLRYVYTRAIPVGPSRLLLRCLACRDLRRRRSFLLVADAERGWRAIRHRGSCRAERDS